MQVMENRIKLNINFDAIDVKLHAACAYPQPDKV
jgi:hypothetical protein